MEKDEESTSTLLWIEDGCRPDTAQIAKIKDMIESLEGTDTERGGKQCCKKVELFLAE